jgi:retinol dehydrogenase-12
VVILSCSLVCFSCFSVLLLFLTIYLAFSPEITPGNNGAFVIPWGRIGKYNTALQHAIKSEEEGGEGRAKKLWEVCERVVGTYL